MTNEDEQEKKDDRKRTKCQSVLRFLYNKDKGSFLGRTAKSWALIILFYIIYYSILTGFFVGMLSVFLYGFVNDKTIPMRTGNNSLLKFAAGVNFMPRLSTDAALISASLNTSSFFAVNYINAVNTYLQSAIIDPKTGFGIDCNSSADQKDLSSFCRFPKLKLGLCSDPLQALLANTMCVYLRVNKIFGWVPQIQNSSLSNDVWVSCDGQNPGDVSSLGKPFYYPNITVGNTTYGLFPNMYFPFVGQPNYVPSIVGVSFPQMKRNIAILVQCQLANVNNINSYNVKFEIFLFGQ